MNGASAWAGQPREIVLDGEIAVPDDRGVAHIDDLQDAIAEHRSARVRIAARLAGLRVGVFWKPADPALYHCRGQRGSAQVNLPLSIVKIRFWLPGRFVVAGFRAGLEKMLSLQGTEGSNPSPSTGESVR
jgi:hypothetical protein